MTCLSITRPPSAGTTEPDGGDTTTGAMLRRSYDVVAARESSATLAALPEGAAGIAERRRFPNDAGPGSRPRPQPSEPTRRIQSSTRSEIKSRTPDRAALRPRWWSEPIPAGVVASTSERSRTIRLMLWCAAANPLMTLVPAASSSGPVIVIASVRSNGAHTTLLTTPYPVVRWSRRVHRRGLAEAPRDVLRLPPNDGVQGQLDGLRGGQCQAALHDRSCDGRSSTVFR